MNVYKQNVIEALEELADESLQRCRWLEQGGPATSSFGELMCQLFDDTGLGDALEKSSELPVFSAPIDDRLRELDEAIAEIDEYMDPTRLIEHPSMKQMRRLAAEILSEIKAQHVDDFRG